MNDLKNKNHEIGADKNEVFKYGLSPLHARIKFFEFILHLSYRYLSTFMNLFTLNICICFGYICNSINFQATFARKSEKKGCEKKFGGEKDDRGPKERDSEQFQTAIRSTS